METNRLLVEEVSRLPLEKVGKALSFVRFLEQEKEEELFIEAKEENELYELRHSSDFISSKEMLAKIKELPND